MGSLPVLHALQDMMTGAIAPADVPRVLVEGLVDDLLYRLAVAHGKSYGALIEAFKADVVRKFVDAGDAAKTRCHALVGRTKVKKRCTWNAVSGCGYCRQHIALAAVSKGYDNVVRSYTDRIRAPRTPAQLVADATGHAHRAFSAYKRRRLEDDAEEGEAAVQSEAAVLDSSNSNTHSTTSHSP